MLKFIPSSSRIQTLSYSILTILHGVSSVSVLMRVRLMLAGLRRQLYASEKVKIERQLTNAALVSSSQF